MEIIKYHTELDSCQKNILVRDVYLKYNENNNIKVDKIQFNNPETCVDFLCKSLNLNKLAEEYMYMIALNNANHPIGVFEISHGTVNMSFANNREIFIRALLCGAASIIVAHNHPSGETNPSTEDWNTTKKIYEAGKLMNIPLLDSIIIGRYTFKSLRTENPDMFQK